MGKYENNSEYSFIGSKNVLGGLPVVEQTQAFIATFRGVVSSTPEQIANASFFITYLVNESGDVFKVSEDSDAQRDILQNFAVGDNVIVRIDQGTLINTQLAGEHKVTGIGSFVPIFITQTGSSDNAFVPFVNFQTPGIEAPDNPVSATPSFLAKSFLSSSVFSLDLTIEDNGTSLPIFGVEDGNLGSPSSSFNIASGSVSDSARDFIGVRYDSSTINTWYTSSNPDSSAASWRVISGTSFASTGSYVINDPKPTFNNITIRVTYGLYNFKFNSTLATIGIFRKRDSTYSLLDTADISLPSLTNISNIYALATKTESSTEFTISTNDILESDEIVAIISNPSVIENWADDNSIPLEKYGTFAQSDQMFLTATTQLLEDNTAVKVPNFSLEIIAQSPGSTVLQPQPSYFTTGSSSSTVITASSVLSSEYGKFQALPTSSADFGFSPINFPFIVNPGDKIRFGYNTDNVFTIFDVKEPPASSRLFITLDRALGSNLNLKNVVLYRNLEDGKFLTLDVPKNDPQFSEIDFTGIIIPKFASPQLKKDANKIIAKLKSEGILTED